VDVGKRGEAPPVDVVERDGSAVVIEDFLDHERVDIHERRLQQVHENADLTGCEYPLCGRVAVLGWCWWQCS
jgi:hypothetical protein